MVASTLRRSDAQLRVRLSSLPKVLQGEQGILANALKVGDARNTKSMPGNRHYVQINRSQRPTQTSDFGNDSLEPVESLPNPTIAGETGILGTPSSYRSESNSVHGLKAALGKHRFALVIVVTSHPMKSTS